MDVLIVESAAKARTLQKYLGKGWAVVATGGHIETLPHDRVAHGKEASKAFWSNRPDELPAPAWVWTERGEDAVAAIVEKGGEDPTFWIATDPDREGEFIAWSLERRLDGKGPIHRVTFQEVTDAAVRAALAAPRTVDRPTAAPTAVRTRVLQQISEFTRSRWEALGIDIGDSAEIMGLMFFRMAEGLAIRQADDPGWDREAFIDLLTEFTLGGIERLWVQSQDVLVAAGRRTTPHRSD